MLAPLRKIELRHQRIALDFDVDRGEINAVGARQRSGEQLGAADHKYFVGRAASGDRFIERWGNDGSLNVVAVLTRYDYRGAARQQTCYRFPGLATHDD